MSNCPTGGHEPPVCVPTTVNCMRQQHFLHKPESITNKHRLQINNLCHCDSYSYLTTPKMTGTDNFLPSLSPLRMRHVVPTRLVQIPSKPSTHRRHVCSLTIMCVQVRRIQQNSLVCTVTRLLAGYPMNHDQIPPTDKRLSSSSK